MSRSLSRALTILDLFNSHKEIWGITEISQELGLSKSTVHGLVKTLEEYHYVEITESGKYRLGFRVFELGMTYQTSARLGTVAEPQVKMLAGKYKQSVHIAIYAGHMAVFVIGNKAGTSNIIFPRTGAGIAAYCTGVGKALLAWQSQTQIEEYLQFENLVSYTPNTITDPGQLREELRKIRECGYALDREETVQGIGCVAAPIFGSADQVIAAISVSGSAAVILKQRLNECIEDVRQAARIIAVSMGNKI
ncbi:MAG TPA: IclR family transcriptional regulator [Syntrophomonadaceae bacterium]|nr:IclR family transcriptional regulator [Syntrophomonadaceae bacterium]HNX28947.1 IclR family transcriptional regulator [Syntrophomonadaceae bacterium]HPR93904.1 IclR family transcriptional regulator [Syntrophomonadaceae bacterium]